MSFWVEVARYDTDTHTKNNSNEIIFIYLALYTTVTCCTWHGTSLKFTYDNINEMVCYTLQHLIDNRCLVCVELYIAYPDCLFSGFTQKKYHETNFYSF